MSLTVPKPAHRTRVVSAVAAIVLLSSLFAISTAGSANAAACSKTYAVSIPNQDPAAFDAGGSGTFTLRFTNTAKNCTSVTIGSLQVNIPAGWSVSSVSPATGWSVDSITSSAFRVFASSGTAKIATGSSADFVVSATAPAQINCDGDPWTSMGWAATTFTSSTFNTTDAPKVKVRCLGLRFDTQPATAEKNQPITSVPGKPDGTPIKVGAYDGNTLVTSFTGQVTISFGVNPAPGGSFTSGSTLTVTAIGGVATFSNVAIDRSNEGYKLKASTSGYSDATSEAFDIVDDYVDCNGDPRAGAASDGRTSGTIQANTSPSFLTVSILSPGLIDCGKYTEITGTVSWKTDDQGNQIGTIVADSTLVKTLRPPDQGAAHFQVCFQPDPGKTGFYDRNDTNHTNLIEYPEAGLLPDCKSDSDTNCVFFRNKTGAGSAVVQFRVADGKGRI